MPTMIRAGAVAAPGMMPATGASTPGGEEAEADHHAGEAGAGALADAGGGLDESRDGGGAEAGAHAGGDGVGDQGAVALGQLALFIQHARVAGGADQGAHSVEHVADRKSDDGRDQRQHAHAQQAAEIHLHKGGGQRDAGQGDLAGRWSGPWGCR